jgi:enoyl-CoA hydratase/carnithine racemase
VTLALFAVREGRFEPHDADLEAILQSRSFTLAIGSGTLAGDELATALACDWFAATADATIDLDSPHAWSVAVWRTGRAALRLLVLHGPGLAAADALSHGLCDLVIESGTDPHAWVEEWIAGRSIAALESGAALIRMRGGDRLERAEFARLFATRGPQEGLRAFLEKRRR